MDKIRPALANAEKDQRNKLMLVCHDDSTSPVKVTGAFVFDDPKEKEDFFKLANGKKILSTFKDAPGWPKKEYVEDLLEKNGMKVPVAK
jgi:hypothetical protein